MEPRYYSALVFVAATTLLYPLILATRPGTYAQRVQKVLQGNGRLTFLITLILCEGTLYFLSVTGQPIYVALGERRRVDLRQNNYLLPTTYYFVSVATAHFYWLLMRIVLTEENEKNSLESISDSELDRKVSKLSRPSLLIACSVGVLSWLMFLRLRF